MRVAVVTGANKGIGYCIAELLLEAGCFVYLGCRDEGRAKEAVGRLAGKGYASMRVLLMDVVDPASVRKSAQDVGAAHREGLDILVNNAGIAYKKESTVPVGEQAAETMAVNYWGTRVVTGAFLPVMKDGGRIVMVSSRAGLLSSVTQPKLVDQLLSQTLTLEGLDGLATDFVDAAANASHVASGWPDTVYGASKLLMSTATRVYAATCSRVVVVACSPGWCKTDMTSDEAPRTAEEGAVTPVWLALGKGGESGKFYGDEQEISY